MSPQTSAHHHANLRSVSAMLVAVEFFAFMNTILKVRSIGYLALLVALRPGADGLVSWTGLAAPHWGPGQTDQI